MRELTIKVVAPAGSGKPQVVDLIRNTLKACGWKVSESSFSYSTDGPQEVIRISKDA